MDIAETSMTISADQVRMQAGIGTLKRVLNASTEVAEILVNDLKSLDLGMQAPQIVDISI